MPNEPESSMVVSDAATTALATAESGKHSMNLMKKQMENISDVSDGVVCCCGGANLRHAGAADERDERSCEKSEGITRSFVFA